MKTKNCAKTSCASWSLLTAPPGSTQANSTAVSRHTGQDSNCATALGAAAAVWVPSTSAGTSSEQAAIDRKIAEHLRETGNADTGSTTWDPKDDPEGDPNSPLYVPMSRADDGSGAKKNAALPCDKVDACRAPGW